MAFEEKTWVDRVSEYPTRRTLTKEDGSTEIVTVTREEGTVSQEGDAFNAENMNDLEARISALDTELNDSIKGVAERTKTNVESIETVSHNLGNLEDRFSATKKEVDDNCVKKSDIVDNLTTASKEKVLSATQGKVLKEFVTSAIGVATFSLQADIKAGASVSVSGEAGISGYYPIGVIQFNTGNANVVLTKAQVSPNANTAYFTIKNTSTSAITITLSYTVLLAKQNSIFSYLN